MIGVTNDRNLSPSKPPVARNPLRHEAKDRSYRTHTLTRNMKHLVGRLDFRANLASSNRICANTLRGASRCFGFLAQIQLFLNAYAQIMQCHEVSAAS